MTREEVILKLKHTMKQASRESVDWDSVNADTDIKTLGFDSLTILDLVYDVQQEFKLDFEAEELVSIDTVGKLADFLNSKISS